MTGLTLKIKTGEYMLEKWLEMKEQLDPPRPWPTYTNFSGIYDELIPMTQKELEEDLKYADSVRRHDFW